MAGFDMMAAQILKSLGIDPEKLKVEFEGRVKAFEENISTLNKALISMDARLATLERSQLLIMQALKIPLPVQLLLPPETIANDGRPIHNDANSSA